MFVVVYNVHAKSPEDARAVCANFNVDLELAQMPGYLQGYCGISVNDPRAVIGVQYWGTQSALQFATEAASSRRVLTEMETYLDGPATSTVYEIL
jgi:hypothetical protein